MVDAKTSDETSVSLTMCAEYSGHILDQTSFAGGLEHTHTRETREESM